MASASTARTKATPSASEYLGPDLRPHGHFRPGANLRNCRDLRPPANFSPLRPPLVATAGFGEFDNRRPARVFERDISALLELFRKVTECARAVVTLRERRVELQQRALQQPQLRRDLALVQNLQCTFHEWQSLFDRRTTCPSAIRAHSAALASRASSRAGDVLVRDELRAVLLHHLAAEGTTTDDKHFPVVLLQFFDQRDEVAVAADDDERVDVGVCKSHLERIEREVDISTVLVAAGRHDTLHEADGMLRHGAAVVAGSLPVAVSDFGDDFSALLDGFEHGADIELAAQGGFDTDFDVIEIDEDGNFQFLIGHFSGITAW